MKVREFAFRRPFGAPEIRLCRVVELPDGEVPAGAKLVENDTPEHEWRPAEEGE